MVDRFSTFTVLVDKLKRSIRKIKTEEIAEFKLKSPHVSCLYYLYRYKSLTSKELAEICDEDKASISRSLDYLEEYGFVHCDTDVRKRYKSPFLLTEKGTEVASRIIEKVDRILDLSSIGLTEEERATVYRGMAVIAENLERICEGYDE